MSGEELDEIEQCFQKGMTVEAALRLVANSGGVCLEYDFNSTLFAVRVGKLIKRKHCSDREVLNLIEDQLSQEEAQMLNEMLKNSYLTKRSKIPIYSRLFLKFALEDRFFYNRSIRDIV